ncbi:hypothetical protein CF319_g6796 [Tilletia indica]|nr:hypothetical protein CF319_g6796 [Tilletia indica]
MPPISSLFAGSPHQILTPSPTATRRKSTILSGTRLFKAGTSSEVITPSSSQSSSSSRTRETLAFTPIDPISASSSLASVTPQALAYHHEDDHKDKSGKPVDLAFPPTPQKKTSHTILRRILQRPFRHRDVLSPSPTPSPSTQNFLCDPAGSISRTRISDGSNVDRLTERAIEDKKRLHRYTWTASPPSTPTNRLGSQDSSITYDPNVPAAPRKVQNYSSTEALFSRYFYHADRSKDGTIATLSTPTASFRNTASRRVTFTAQDLLDSDSSDDQSQHSAIAAIRANQSADTSQQQLGPLSGLSMPHRKPTAASSSGLSAAAAGKHATSASARLSRFIPRSLRSLNNRLSIASLPARRGDNPTEADWTTPTSIPMSSTLPQLPENGPAALITNHNPVREHPQHHPSTEISAELLRDAAELMVRFNSDFDEIASQEERSVDPTTVNSATIMRSKSTQSLLERWISAHRLSISKSTRNLKALQRRSTTIGAKDARSSTTPNNAAAAPGSALAVVTADHHTNVEAAPRTPIHRDQSPSQHVAAAQPSPLPASCHGYEPLPVENNDSRPNISAWLRAVAQANFMERYDLELSVHGTDSEASVSPLVDGTEHFEETSHQLPSWESWDRILRVSLDSMDLSGLPSAALAAAAAATAAEDDALSRGRPRSTSLDYRRRTARNREQQQQQQTYRIHPQPSVGFAAASPSLEWNVTTSPLMSPLMSTPVMEGGTTAEAPLFE